MNETDQTDAIAFLGSGSAHGCAADDVGRVETHGALVFLGPRDAFKIKRAVCFPYMDLTTLASRRRLCGREFELNAAQAPDLYLGVVPIVRRSDGSLGIGGDGEPIEWALHMRRFAANALMSHKADSAGIDTRLAVDIADAVFYYHATAVPRTDVAPRARMEAVIAGLAAGLATQPTTFDRQDVGRLIVACRSALDQATGVLEARAAAGHVRRCHGDLHLDNIVQWRGRPVLFDALEFDEDLATVDTLYDLAFLLMDLDVRERRGAANVVLNRYLWRSGVIIDLDGLAALPLFQAARAAVRAMVLAQRAALKIGDGPAGEETCRRAAAYLRAAHGYLTVPAPSLLAVGGMSGTGKSTLAAALAPGIGAAPGAVILRSDLERKAMLGVEETARLPDEAYTQEINRKVYDRLLARARAALLAGHAAIIDAAFLQSSERREAEALAAAISVPFTGLWLTAPPDILAARIESRVGDASDATVAVLRKQMAWHPDGAGWLSIDASGEAARTLANARCALGMRAAD
jgi:aminoglycoside phosphotransferase family enzyme/predicted kinase